MKIIQGDCLVVLHELPDNSIDSVVTDPPYFIEFLGSAWDTIADPARGSSARSIQEWHYAWAKEALRVLKPGGHLLAFSGPRTYHRLASAVEDAGFEIRDMIVWVHAQGWPKNLDISKALDKRAGAERRVVGHRKAEGGNNFDQLRRGEGRGDRPSVHGSRVIPITEPSTELAERWRGWGSALKPSQEPLVLARKPLIGTLAENVEVFGTGGLNIDGCQIPLESKDRLLKGGSYSGNRTGSRSSSIFNPGNGVIEYTDPPGRWPANIAFDETAASLLDEMSGVTKSGAMKREVAAYEGESVTRFLRGRSGPSNQYGDSGGASRFFFVSKPSKRERNSDFDGLPIGTPNTHPTLKPLELMRYLVRLITPLGGTVLDPFAGSGTTLMAARVEGFDFIGVEKEPEFVEIARQRVGV